MIFVSPINTITLDCSGNVLPNAILLADIDGNKVRKTIDKILKNIFVVEQWTVGWHTGRWTVDFQSISRTKQCTTMETRTRTWLCEFWKWKKKCNEMKFSDHSCYCWSINNKFDWISTDYLRSKCRRSNSFICSSSKCNRREKKYDKHLLLFSRHEVVFVVPVVRSVVAVEMIRNYNYKDRHHLHQTMTNNNRFKSHLVNNWYAIRNV